MLQPDEETGSAGERPVSNMATPILITRTVRESSWWRLLFCFQAGLSAKRPIPLVRKQSLVAGYVGQQPVKGLVFHGDTAHERQYRFFGRHGRTHSCHSPEVPVQTPDPVGGVCHGLNLRSMVQVSHVSLVVGVVTHEFECPVVLSPLLTHILPFLPCRLNGVITLSGTEYVTQIRSQGTLVTMTDLSQHIAFQMCYASLKRRPGEFFPYNDIKPLNTVCNHKPDPLNAPFL